MNSHLRNSLPPAAFRSRGFTLVELAAVLVVASILLAAGLPTFSGLIRKTRLTTATNDLFASLVLARSEAARRGSRVALCKSSNGATCATTGGWDQGWIVFHDANNNGTHDAGEQVVWRAQAISKDLRLSGNLTVAKYVSYAPTGETKLTGGGFQAGTITLCNESAGREEGRQIVISSSGRPRVQKVQLASCV